MSELAAQNATQLKQISCGLLQLDRKIAQLSKQEILVNRHFHTALAHQKKPTEAKHRVRGVIQLPHLKWYAPWDSSA
jgi:hypothetical protein